MIFISKFLSQVWPQYLSLGTAHDLLTGKPDWTKKRSYYMRNISTFEPFIESIAQLITKLCIWTFFTQAHLEKFQGDENPLFTKPWQRYFFYFTTCVSGLASILGVIRFFKEGPVRFLPQTGAVNGVLTLKFILTFFSSLFNALAKILLLILLLYFSLGLLPIFSPTPPGLDLVGTVSDPLCSKLTLVQACRDTDDSSFQVRLHFPDSKYTTGIPWVEPEPEWRVFVRDENYGVRMFWNANKSEWWSGGESCLREWNYSKCEEGLENNCGPSESMQLYCSDSIDTLTLSRLIAFNIWFGLNIFPQFMFATLVLLLVNVRGALQAFLHFPELTLSPALTNIMFGPKHLFWDCCSKSDSKDIRLRPKLCWVNNFLSLFGNIVSLSLLYIQHCKADPLHRSLNIWGFLNYLVHANRIKSSVISLPPGLALFFHIVSVLLSSFVIHFNSSQCFSLKSSFFGSLEYQESDIGSLVHQLEDPDNLCVAANLYKRKRRGDKNNSRDEGDSPQATRSVLKMTD